jgi:hypothetical protein
MFHMMNADLARDQAQERTHALELENARRLSREPLEHSNGSLGRRRRSRR